MILMSSSARLKERKKYIRKLGIDRYLLAEYRHRDVTQLLERCTVSRQYILNNFTFMEHKTKVTILWNLSYLFTSLTCSQVRYTLLYRSVSHFLSRSFYGRYPAEVHTNRYICDAGCSFTVNED